MTFNTKTIGSPFGSMIGSAFLPAHALSRVPIPENLAIAIDSVSGGLLISWDAGTADTYKVYYRLDSGDWTLIDETAETDYTYSPAAAGEYEFAVSALKGGRESAKAEWVSTDGIFDDVPDAEGIALMSFYEATNGDAWTTITNWMVDPVVNNWHGVTVAGGHVTALSLPDNNLDGDISAFTFLEMPSLALIDFTGNASLVDTSVYDATLSDLRISAVDGTAFIDNAAVLTAYADGEHYIRIYDAAGRLLRGVLGSVGTGEVLGDDLIANGGFETGDPPASWDAINESLLESTIDAYSGSAALKVTKGATSLGVAANNGLTLLNEALYAYGFWGKIETATNVNILISGFNLGNVTNSSWTKASGYRINVSFTSLFRIGMVGGIGSIGFVDDVSLKQVLSPSTYGVTILNDTLTAKNANFVFNATSYRVQVKAI